MDNLTLALDWTPNTNHIGFFVAREKGFYAASNLDVTITDPSRNNYAETPAKQVELGKADFALCPTESIISYRTKSTPFPLVAIAAVLQYDLSAIAVRAGAGVATPKDLDGKRYASYQARYEDGIVRAMIRADGGAGDLDITYPAKLGIWNTLLAGDFDATWVFLNWEGVQVASTAPDIRYFKMADYGIPYSYSPVIAANAAALPAKAAAYRAFLEATKQGYLYAKAHPEEAVAILQPLVPEHDQNIDLLRSLELSAPAFGDAENWGQLEETTIGEFLDWLTAEGLEAKRLPVTEVIAPGLI